MDKKLIKLREKRDKSQHELENAQVALNEVLNLKKRKVVVERHVVSCKELLAKAVAKNDELIKLVSASDEAATLTSEFESWLSELTVSNDNILANARDYVDTLGDEKSVSEASHVSQSSRRQTNARKSRSSQVSGTSSQRKKEQEIAKLSREELERQATADLILAKTKHEAALRGKQMKLRMLEEELREEEEMSRLELEVLDEENRRKMTEAKLKEAELEDAMSETSHNHDEAELNDEAANEKSRTREWVDNTENNPVVTYGTGNRHETDSVIAIDESLRTSNNVTTAALNEALPGVIVPPVDPNANILGVNLSPQAVPPFDQRYSTNSSPNFNNHRVFLQAVQNTAIGNHNQLPSVMQSQLPLMNPYARPFQPSASVCALAPRPAGQVQTHATPASVQQSINTTGPNSNQTQSRSHQSVTFAPTHGSSTGTTNELTQPNTAVSHPVTINELVGLLSREDPLPELKLYVYNGDPLQWHEWYGQFGATDS